MDELNSFNQQVDDQFQLRVGMKETPQLINFNKFTQGHIKR